MRLIDADLLIKKLNAIRWKMANDTTPIQALEVKFGNEMLDNLVIGTVLASMSTAYDIDKVLEELEKEYATEYGRQEQIWNRAIERAIEIVKDGGNK